MGFDITWHPITRQELHKFVFDVTATPALKQVRAAQLTTNPTKRQAVITLYDQLQDLLDQARAGEVTFSSAVAFGTAAIAGYLHPYWYGRGGCVSFLCDDDASYCQYLESLHDMVPGLFHGIPDDGQGRIRINYVGGGYIDLAHLPELRTRLSQDDAVIEQAMGAENAQALQHAITYAVQHEAGILEASDIMVPFSGECYTDADNFRAEFLQTDTDYTNAREGM